MRDFGKASRVIANRLELGMTLGFDSTINYALGIDDLTLVNDQLDCRLALQHLRQRRSASWPDQLTWRGSDVSGDRTRLKATGCTSWPWLPAATRPSSPLTTRSSCSSRTSSTSKVP